MEPGTTTTSERVLENLVGGTWRAPNGRELIEVRDPSDTRTVVARMAAMSADDIAELYDHAQRGFAVWRRFPALERAAILTEAARLIRQRQDMIATDLVLEMGKTLSEARVEVVKSADFLEFYGGTARLPYGELLHDGRPGTLVSVRTEPAGVVLAITPWNDPLLTPARKLAPALMAGNAVIIKPASETPIVALHLAAALHDAGLPPGVLGTASGRGGEISRALLSDPRLAAVSFTGSNEVGVRIKQALVAGNVRLQAELGGKNAAVVLEDADLERAAQTIIAGAYGQAGQRCTATSRVVVEASVSNQLIGELCTQATRLRLGPGLDSDTDMGPLVSSQQQASVLEHLEGAVDQGAQLALGGGRPTEERLRHGCYVEPSIVVGSTSAMGIWRNEIFGPVVTVRQVRDLAQAIEAVNDSPFGLAASLFTNRLDAAHIFSERVDVGQVAINLPTSGWDVHVPFGGFGESGSGSKEQGLEGLRFYTRVKTVATRAKV